tara:strand:+ start:3066 stop:3407 length:342 start_codon:yes stop_codon:yes gene_type:complete
MEAKLRRRFRNRNKVKKSSRNRLSIFRSNRNIFAQVIDDISGKTIVSASSLEKIFKDIEKKSKYLIEEKLGDILAKRSLEKGIKKVVFDKGSYTYHGRIKAFADSARKSGLDF